MFGQNPLKDVDSRVFTRMLRKDGPTDRRMDSSVTISLCNFVGEGIIRSHNISYCLIEVVTKAGFTVSIFFSYNIDRLFFSL
jgi:hypothetical protein